MISQEIKRLRTLSGLSQKALGARLGVGQSTVAMWECGKNSPGYDMLIKLAALFDVSVSSLCGTEEKTLSVPVLGSVAAGRPIDAVEDVVGYEELPSETAHAGEFFALRIRGSSMEPRILEGDTVIVRRQNSVENGEIAIVLVGGEEATCKKFYRHSDGISLVSINPAYEPMFFSEAELRHTRLEVLGKVCELRARF